MEDPLTRAAVDVLWVKGSGGDLGSMTIDGFATLYLGKLQALKGSIAGASTRTRWSATSRTARSA